MRIALVSDIHEDIVSLRIAINRISKLNCDQIVCLGDISGFSAPHYDYYDTRNASACLKLVQENCEVIIKGNHDLHAVKQTPIINPDFEYPSNWYQMDYHQRKELSKGQVWLYDNDELNPLYKNENLEVVKSFSEFEVIDIETYSVFYSHYCYPNLTGSNRLFYNNAEELELHKAFVTMQGGDLSFVGHRHFAGLIIASSQKFIEKRYHVKYQLKTNDCVFVPAISAKRFGNGFCIFDTNDFTVEALRI